MKINFQKFFPLYLLVCFLLGFCQTADAQNVKRVVIIKADGLPMGYVDRFVKEREPMTGKSKLPWIEEVFYKNGTRLNNFYVRGLSLSAPSWSLLDTGQHLQIKGNVEFDRYVLSTYYYLNFIPFQIEYGLGNQIDMPGVEMLDRLRIPLLADAFPFEKRVVGYQLFQRSNTYKTFAKGIAGTIPFRWQDLVDEYTIGFDFREAPQEQVEKDVIRYLSEKPEADYLDYFTSNFDHTAHHVNDDYSKYKALQGVDRAVGRIWMAIQKSSRADETALILVSDHGTNSQDGVFSQGFSLLRLLGSSSGGGHHIVTKRRPLGKYSITPEIPVFPIVITSSKGARYLKGESSDYPTVLMDFDGNERSALYFRDNDFNLLQILLKELKSKKLPKETRAAGVKAFFKILDRRRTDWEQEISQMEAELQATERLLAAQQKTIESFPKEYTPQDIRMGINRANVRFTRLHKIAAGEIPPYRQFLQTMNNLLSLRRETFQPEKIKIADILAKRSMGRRNSVYQLQNYAVGLSPNGLTLDEKGEIDWGKSLLTIDYPHFLQSQKVINNVQKELSNRPIDFVSTTIPLESIAPFLSKDLLPDLDPVWVFGGREKQALILTRRDTSGALSIRYLPVAELQESAEGQFSFRIKDWDSGFPLKIYEDASLNVGADKAAWLNQWHTESEWLKAVHQTNYSNGIISLIEQQNQHSIRRFEDNQNDGEDEKLSQRMTLRQRELVRPDLLVMANDHWNFNDAEFNPGGNHGSFLRVSSHSVWMIAGGNTTGIPRGLTVATPYDSLSFVPTVLALMGKADRNGNPSGELYEKGFRRMPGRIVEEFFAAEEIEKKFK